MSEESRHYEQVEALLHTFGSTGAMEPLYRMFQLLDLDGDGRISKDELLAFYRSCAKEGEAAEATRSFFKLGDTNQDGYLDAQEFLALFLHSPEQDKALSHTDAECKRLLAAYNDSRDDQWLESCFRLLDSNGDGVVSKAELAKSYLCKSTEREEVARVMMQLGDVNQDGVLSLQEFMRLIKQSL